MILRVPDIYDEFSCIASRCKDSCCAGWEIDIDEDSYGYYMSCEGEFGEHLKQSMYEDEEGGHRFKLKGPKRCAMLNDDNLCDLYTALGEEALCDVCTEYPRFFLYYKDVEQKGLSLSCEEAGRILFSRKDKDSFMDLELPGDCEEDDEEDLAYIEFLEWAVLDASVSYLQDRSCDIETRMRNFFCFCEMAQDVINHYLAKDNDPKVLRKWRMFHPVPDILSKPGRHFSHRDFEERFLTFSNMEELDDEWINIKRDFDELFSDISYPRQIQEYLDSPDYDETGYEHLLVYFLFRYMMNAAHDYDILTYAKMVIVSTLVVRDMDAARFIKNGGKFTLFDRIDIARIFSKEVEHSEGNAEDLKEMCMMEEIASPDYLYRQI